MISFIDIFIYLLGKLEQKGGRDMRISDNRLYYNEEKLKYVVKLLGLTTKDIAQKLEMRDSFISKLFNYKTNKLKRVYLYAFCNAYNIPMEIFDNKEIDTESKIEKILSRKQNVKPIFHHHREELEKLIGVWYFYSYPSNPRLTDVWETKTTFYEDYSVEDEHKNRGTLYIGQNQSVILKESRGSKNITTITFDNARIFYNIFPFSRVSKSNGMNKELFNFGVCSRKKIDKDLIKDILGNISEVQLQMNYALLERITSYIEMDI